MTLNLRNFLTLLVLASSVTPAVTQQLAAKDFLKLCTSKDEREEAICTSYVAGFIGAIGVVQAQAPSSKMCPPPQITPIEVREVFVRFMRTAGNKGQELMFLPPNVAFWLALEFAYPCRK